MKAWLHTQTLSGANQPNSVGPPYCTVIDTSVEAVMFVSLESVAVTVNVYFPAVVAGVAGGGGDEETLLPPQPMAAVLTTSNAMVKAK